MKHLKPPLHRKYSETDSLKQIRNRYRGMKGTFDAQVRALQSNTAFLERCQKLYNTGYKDWHILSAIMNRMIALEGKRRGYDLRLAADRADSEKIANELNEVVFPASEFDGFEWEFAFKMHAITCLATYGFERRSAVMAPDVLIRFLRERMLHFDHDIPHPPMFGIPPNVWPRV